MNATALISAEHAERAAANRAAAVHAPGLMASFRHLAWIHRSSRGKSGAAT
jgi:hypothetical protein